MKVTRVVPRLSRGGACRSALELVRQAPREVSSTIVSLEPATQGGAALASAAGADLVDGRSIETAHAAMASADVVVLHFWNTPAMGALLDSELPAMRLLVWSHVLGAHAPQVLTHELVALADHVAVTSPLSLALPAMAIATDRASVIPAILDPSRVTGHAPQPHDGFVVGYVGAVDFEKLHRRFVPLCAAVAVPDVRFVVCGSGTAGRTLVREAEALGLADRLELRGWTDDIAAQLSTFDVFGYPLCPDTYATGEKSLLEAMLAGVPPVVLPHGGVAAIVTHERNGLVADDEAGYAAAIERLHGEPALRARLGRQAAVDARQIDPAAAARTMYATIATLLNQPKAARPRPPATIVPPTGAGRFVRALGDKAGDFVTSMAPPTPALALVADRRIAAASDLLKSGHAGGILHYRKAYPDDPWLRLWSGLVLRAEGRTALAAAEYRAAASLGCSDARPWIYLADLADAIGSGALAESARAMAKAADDTPQAPTA